MKVKKKTYIDASKACGISSQTIVMVWKLIQTLEAGNPKSPKSSWIFYTTLMKKKNPKVSTKELGPLWANLSQDEKEPYEQLAIEDKERFVEQRAKWNAKNDKLLSEQQTDESKYRNMTCKELKKLCTNNGIKKV